MKIAVISITIIVLLLCFFLVFIYLLYSKKIRTVYLEKQLLQSQHQQDILQTQLEIQEQTLKTVSEELHDNIGQMLGLAKLNLNNLLATLPEGPARPKAESAKQSVSKAINDLRQLARTLHGDKIAEIGLEEAIDAQLKIIQNSGAFTTGLTVSGEPYTLEGKQEMVLFRMVQELLNNAVKHSRGTHIDIALAYQPAIFTLTVSDNGTGFDAATLHSNQTETGIGLTSLRNRAALINGTIVIHSGATEGTAAVIELQIGRDGS